MFGEGDVTYVWAGTEWYTFGVVVDYMHAVSGWACSRNPDTVLTAQV